MIELKLTEAQVQSLANLLDLAVRSGGMKAALEAVPLVETIQKALDDRKKGGGDA